MGHITRDVVDGRRSAPGRRRLLRDAGARTTRRRRARRRRPAAPRIDPRSFRRSRRSACPVTWHESSTTTAYSFHYEGDRRIMWQDAVGDPWTPEQAVEAAGDATWIDVCALTRTDFPPDTLAALDPGGRQLLVDLQGLVRTADDRAAADRREHRRRAPVRRDPQAERRGGEDARRQRGAREAARARASRR